MIQKEDLSFSHTMYYSFLVNILHIIHDFVHVLSLKMKNKSFWINREKCWPQTW